MSLLRSIVWLGEDLGSDAGLVGPKAAQLSRLAAAHPVPEGFCLTAEAYRIAAREGGLTDELANHVREAYARLVRNDTGQAVAVRSSAIDEDGPFASFAGQHDTHLNVIGFDAVMAAIDGTWRSLRSDAALAYRRRHGLSVDGMALAVLVQHMVPADVAGVAFSADPVAKRRDVVVVSASWGLGESVVGGSVTPDVWNIDKPSLAIVSKHHADKRRMSVASDGGIREVDVPGFLRLRPSLTEAQAREVAAVARDLEQAHGWPVDIEFALSGGRFHLLQCRPITTLGDATADASGAGDDATGADGGADGATGATGGSTTRARSGTTSGAKDASGGPAADPLGTAVAAEAASRFRTTDGVPLPEPEWVEPEDAARHWRRDVAHFPTPITALDDGYLQIIERGHEHAVTRYRLAFWYKLRRFWAHHYEAEGTLDAAPDLPEGVTALTLDAQVADLGRAWAQQWLPALRSHLDHWSTFDLVNASDEALLAHFDDTLERAQQAWNIHFELVFPVIVAKRRFLELYGELFQPSSPLEPLALLRGFDNLTTRAGHAAWRLRDEATRSPDLVEALLAQEPDEAVRTLDGLPEDHLMRQALDTYLGTYGQRTHHLAVSADTLAEDPTPIVKQVQDALSRPDYDPEQARIEAADEREKAGAAAREALRGYPQTVRDEFESRLAAAQVAVRLNEDHNYLIDYSTTAAVRRVLLEVGRRLAKAGLLDTHKDVVHLTMDEAREGLQAVLDGFTGHDARAGHDMADAAGAGGADATDAAGVGGADATDAPGAERASDDATTDAVSTMRRRAARGRADFERFADAAVPYEFGTETPPSTSAGASDDDEGGKEDSSAHGNEGGNKSGGEGGAKAGGKRSEASSNSPAHTGIPPRTLTGTPGSSGVVRGRVRVLRTFSDASQFQPGEVLVAPTTAQPWTPLFATAAALVTDAGGMLSHSAVVAREYGLPAVVGVGNATATLRDGMWIEVDGDRGTVRVLDRGA